MKDKLLAEWFWSDRWMGSSAFLLPMEARGLYREMLTAAWRRGASLPNDHEAIRRAIGCTTREWSRAWPKIARYWKVDGELLVNETQQEVYAEAKASRDRASERGRKGAQATAQARAQAQNKRVLKSQPPSPSPNKQQTDNGSAPAPPTPAVATDWNREAADDFKAAYGADPPRLFFAQVKSVAKRYGWARTRPALREYMAETPIEYLNVAKCLAVKVERGGPARVRGRPVTANNDAVIAAFVEKVEGLK